ncbi:hypothetical protein HDU96_007810 [Phlyctochytrium bullatum]|nr:hypothetical protein HDU96_007810 [Phlyctochytrium bullatum]
MLPSDGVGVVEGTVAVADDASAAFAGVRAGAAVEEDGEVLDALEEADVVAMLGELLGRSAEVDGAGHKCGRWAANKRKKLVQHFASDITPPPPPPPQQFEQHRDNNALGMRTLSLVISGHAHPDPGVGGWGVVCYSLGATENPNKMDLSNVLFRASGMVVITPATIHVAEYIAFINGMHMVLQRLQCLDPRRVHLIVRGNSEVVVVQMRGERQPLDPKTRMLHAVARGLARRFATVKFKLVPLEEIGEAVTLATLGRSREPHALERTAFCPNLNHSIGVVVNGVVFQASTGVCAAEENGQSMVDVWILLRDMVQGLKTLEGLTDPAPFAVVEPCGTRRGAAMGVVGILPSLDVHVMLRLSGGERKGILKIALKNVLVVVGLPVPLHIAMEKNHDLEEQLRKCGASLGSLIRGQPALVPEKLRMEFRNCDYWKA